MVPSPDGDDAVAADNESPLVLDPERGTELTLSGSGALMRADMEALSRAGGLEYETEVIDGEELVTAVSVNMEYLANVMLELDTVEHELGERWPKSGWNPRLSIRS